MGYGANPANTAAPANFGTQQNPSVYGQAAGQYNAAVQGPNIGQFFNPYTSMVTGNTVNALDRSRQMAQNQIGTQATAAGAFGGSRHGVAEAETNRNFFDSVGQTIGGLQQTGFNTALGAAQQNQQMQSQLAGQGFGFGQSIGNQQAAQGGLQQGMQQMLIDAAKGQYAGWTGAPQASLGLPMAAVGGAGALNQNTQTTTEKRGLFDYLTSFAGILGGLGGR
jgi:hypothetical protein